MERFIITDKGVERDKIVIIHTGGKSCSILGVEVIYQAPILFGPRFVINNLAVFIETSSNSNVFIAATYNKTIDSREQITFDQDLENFVKSLIENNHVTPAGSIKVD